MESHSSLSIEELVQLCAESGGYAAWQEFVRRLHRLIAKVVLRTAARLGDASPQTVDDLIQETYLKFCTDDCRMLRNFDHRHPGSFLGFVQVVAANVVRDHFRSSTEKQIRSGQYVTETEESWLPAPEHAIGNHKAIERHVLIQQVSSYLDQCVSGPDQVRNRRVFWLYYRMGLSSGAIAALPGIGLTIKGVESLIFRLTREVRERMVARPQNQDPAQGCGGKGIQATESF
jgi:RNA polymerase sigma-70 factor (ECF subfamily)